MFQFRIPHLLITFSRYSCMESSFVFKAKTALHTAAAKAERVLTEIKADFKQDFGLNGSASANSESETKADSSSVGNTEYEDKCQNPNLMDPKGPKFLLDKQIEETTVNGSSVRQYSDDISKDESTNHVPKKMREQEFWRRCFATVKQGKHNILEKDKKQDISVVPLTLDEGSCMNAAVPNLEMESPKKDPAEEEAYAKAFTMVSIPPSLIVRQLASAVEVGRSFKLMKELAVLNRDPLQGNDWPGFVPSFSAMKVLSLRDKDGKLRAQLDIDGGNHSLLWSLFGSDRVADTTYSKKKCNDGSILSPKAQLAGDVHGAPPGSFVSQLAEIMAGIKTTQKMAEFWLQVVAELRRLWNEGQPIPWLPIDDNPELQYCLLHQRLQVINCCIARKKRHLAALKMLDSGNEEDDPNNKDQVTYPVNETWAQNLNTIAPALYAKTKTGELVPRLGVLHPAENLTMLETGEPVFSPIIQEGPVLTEDLIRETEELILRTGSVGAGCSQLLSDMQAFKAANPGCILEDFVRWYSPPDWSEVEVDHLSDETSAKDDDSSRRGRLSSRMQSKGNLWQELWESAKPIPAAKQAPLFDEDLAGESTLNYLEEIAPSDFFEQLFIVALSSGFIIAEAAPAMKNDIISKWFTECKEYVISTCCNSMDTETLEDLCQVYETMEAIIVHPHENILTKAGVSTNIEIPTAEVPKGPLEKFGIHSVYLPKIEKHIFGKRVQGKKRQTERDENHHNLLSRFMEGKNSLFGKKLPKPASMDQDKKLLLSENEWTIL